MTSKIYIDKEEYLRDMKSGNLKIQVGQYSHPYCDILELKSQIKHLKDLQANQDKEVESLRDLLKECKPYLEIALDDELLADTAITEYILTRINTAIGESEE